MREAMESALDDGPSGELSTPKPEGEKQPKPGEPPKGDKPAEDQPNVPFSKHPAWLDQLSKRRAAETKAATFEKQVGELKEPAHNWGVLSGQMEKHGITTPQLSAGIKVMAAWNNDKPTALKMLEAQIAYLRQELGEDLSEDLRAKVEAGELTEEVARDYSRTAAKAKSLETQNQERQSTQAKQQQSERVKQFQDQVVQGWNARAKALSARDPSFGAKSPLMQTHMQAQLAEKGHPKSLEAANKMVDDAYAWATAEVARLAPEKRPMRPMPVSGRPVTTTSAPGDMLEAMRNVLENAA